MVKVGTKRKSDMKKIRDKNSLATTFTKWRHDLYSKASQYCLLTGSQIAIIATPSYSLFQVSFYSFGHSSDDAIVSAYLSGQSHVPVQEVREDLGVCLAMKELGLGFWWEDERLAISKDPEEIQDVMKSMNSLLSDARKFLAEEAGTFSQREVVVVTDEMKGKRNVVLKYHNTANLTTSLTVSATITLHYMHETWMILIFRQFWKVSAIKTMMILRQPLWFDY